MTSPVWKIGLHVHTVYSPGSLIPIEDLHKIVQERELDKLAITDLNTVRGAVELATLYPMWVIPGIELTTSQGNLLGWYVSEDIEAGLEPTDAIARLRDQGALIGVPYPFDARRKGSWERDDLLEIIDKVDAIEVFNPRCRSQEPNESALNFAQKHAKMFVAGSDAYLPREVGSVYLEVPPFGNNADGLRGALMNSHWHPGELIGWQNRIESALAPFIKRFKPGLQR